MATYDETEITESAALFEDDSDVFDPNEALERTCDDLELLAELADLFTDNCNLWMMKLAVAVETGDSAGIDRAAHALKGSIGTFSTRQPFEIARELEFCGKENRLEQTPQLFAALSSAIVELETAVHQFLAAHR